MYLGKREICMKRNIILYYQTDIQSFNWNIDYEVYFELKYDVQTLKLNTLHRIVWNHSTNALGNSMNI